MLFEFWQGVNSYVIPFDGFCLPILWSVLFIVNRKIKVLSIPERIKSRFGQILKQGTLKRNRNCNNLKQTLFVQSLPKWERDLPSKNWGQATNHHYWHIYTPKGSWWVVSQGAIPYSSLFSNEEDTNSQPIFYSMFRALFQPAKKYCNTDDSIYMQFFNRQR